MGVPFWEVNISLGLNFLNYDVGLLNQWPPALMTFSAPENVWLSRCFSVAAVAQSSPDDCPRELFGLCGLEYRAQMSVQDQGPMNPSALSGAVLVVLARCWSRSPLSQRLLLSWGVHADPVVTPESPPLPLGGLWYLWDSGKWERKKLGKVWTSLSTKLVS